MAQHVTRFLADNGPSPEPTPQLEPGDRLTRPEFERRYDAMVAEIPAENMRLHLCLRAADGIVLVDTCPTRDVFVAFSAPAYKRFYDLCRGKILYDPELVEEIRPDAPERHVMVPATALAKERLNNVLFANMIMLGALTRLAGMDYAAMKPTMLEVIPRFHEQNLAALELGYTLPAVTSPALT